MKITAEQFEVIYQNILDKNQDPEMANEVQNLQDHLNGYWHDNPEKDDNLPKPWNLPNWEDGWDTFNRELAKHNLPQMTLDETGLDTGTHTLQQASTIINDFVDWVMVSYDGNPEGEEIQNLQKTNLFYILNDGKSPWETGTCSGDGDVDFCGSYFDYLQEGLGALLDLETQA
jgi:hypothetical protein